MKQFNGPFLNDLLGKWIVEEAEDGKMIEIHEFKTDKEATDFLAAKIKEQNKIKRQANKPIVEKDDIELTNDQWDMIVKEWNSRPNNPPSLYELIQLVFKNPELDGRTKEGRAVRKRLAKAGMKPKTTGDYDAKTVSLTEEHKKFIKSNIGTMKAVEMAEVLFDKPNLTNLSAETRAVIDEIKKFKEENPFEDPDDLITDDYSPPKTLEGVLRKVNKYHTVKLERDKLLGKQKRDLASLIDYLNSYRFIHQMNTFERIQDRELFESVFVRSTWDKGELEAEEVDQYIVYALECVLASSILIRTEKLKKMLDDCTDDIEGKKISLGLVEALKSLQEDYHKSVQRQEKLLSSLKVKRSEKEGKAKEGAATILNLVQAWRDQEKRQSMLKYAELRKQKLKEGIEEIANFDDFKAKFIGISEEEILNG